MKNKEWNKEWDMLINAVTDVENNRVDCCIMSLLSIGGYLYPTREKMTKVIELANYYLTNYSDQEIEKLNKMLIERVK